MTFFATIWTVAVFCGGAGPSYYSPNPPKIVLDAKTCQTISYAPAVRDLWNATHSVFTLAHEEGHAHDPMLIYYFANGARAGTPEWSYLTGCGAVGQCEATADCYAAGHIYTMARRLGYSGYNARRIRRLAHYFRNKKIGYETIPQRCWT